VARITVAKEIEMHVPKMKILRRGGSAVLVTLAARIRLAEEVMQSCGRRLDSYV